MYHLTSPYRMKGFDCWIEDEHQVENPKARHKMGFSTYLDGVSDGETTYIYEALTGKTDKEDGTIYNMQGQMVGGNGMQSAIRSIMSKDMEVCLEAPSKVGLFIYDNKTLVVENFNDEPVEVRIVTGDKVMKLESLEDETVLTPLPAEPIQTRRPVTPKNTFRLLLLPHSYKAFQYK